MKELSMKDMNQKTYDSEKMNTLIGKSFETDQMEEPRENRNGRLTSWTYFVCFPW